VLTAALATLLLSAASPRTLSLDPGASEIRYHVVHKLHRVDAVTRSVEGRAVIGPRGHTLAMIRVPVASFRSGDGNRDAHMQEVLETGHYPFVVFKGIAELGGAVMPAGTGAPETRVEVQGEIELHGVKRQVVVPLGIVFAPDGGARVRGSFEVSLDSFHIERPSLLFVKIEDTCRIDVDLVFREARP
jgi:polyisoprenoid-binding protein YceI